MSRQCMKRFISKNFNSLEQSKSSVNKTTYSPVQLKKYESENIYFMDNLLVFMLE